MRLGEHAIPVRSARCTATWQAGTFTCPLPDPSGTPPSEAVFRRLEPPTLTRILNPPSPPPPLRPLQLLSRITGRVLLERAKYEVVQQTLKQVSGRLIGCAVVLEG